MWYGGKWNTAAVCQGGGAGMACSRPGGEWYGKVPPGRRAGGTPQRGRGWEWYTKEIKRGESQKDYGAAVTGKMTKLGFNYLPPENL